MVHFRALRIGMIALTLIGCGESPEFRSSVPQSDRTPWTHLEFHNDPDHFQFAIIGDLAGGYRPKVFRRAVRRLNLLQPGFVMSVGDLIETWGETHDARISDRNEIESPATASLEGGG